MATSQDMTEEQKERYDRQIRLWGAAAQERMQRSHVVVVNLGGLSAEVVKNVVLSGVGLVHILDPNPTTPLDLSSNFFLREEDIGKPRATAARERIQALNPLMTVTAEIESPEVKGDDFWKKFQVMVVTDSSLSVQKLLNEVARRHSMSFFSGNTYGLHCMFFADHGPNFEYMQLHAVTRVEEVIVENYITLEEACRMSWKLVKPCNPFLKCHILLGAWDDKELTLERLITIRDELLVDREVAKRDQKGISEEDLKSLCSTGRGDLSPVCTVVGGVLAQEVLKCVQRTFAPLHNFFVYDGSMPDTVGVVERLPPAPKVRLGVVVEEVL